MKRRSRAGGERIKGRRPKTPEPVRGNAPKGQARSKLSPAIEETEVARLTRELTDERRQRVATSEVLRLLSGSYGDLTYLFDTILANATNLCQANFGTLSLCEGHTFRIVAMHNAPPGLAELRRREPLVRAAPLLRMAETKRLLHIADYTEYVASHPADSDAAAFAKLTGVRTILEVPMLKDDDLVGAIVIYRKEVRRFDDRGIAVIKDFAAAKANFYTRVLRYQRRVCLALLHKGHTSEPADRHVTDVVGLCDRGQRLALGNPRQSFGLLMLSRAWASFRTEHREPWLGPALRWFGSGLGDARTRPTRQGRQHQSPVRGGGVRPRITQRLEVRPSFADRG